jgi:hypothetical protein
MLNVLNVLFDLVKNRAAYVVALYVAVLFVADRIAGALTKAAAVVDQLDTVTRPTFSSAGLSLSPFSLMNYVLPLDLGVTLFAAWLAFHLACTALRIVKAWIPTLS